MDAIAEIVASSGLSGSGLASGHYGRKPPEAREVPPPAPRSKTVPILIGSAVVIVLLLGVVIGLLMKGGGWGSPNTGGTTPGNDGKSSTPDPVTPAPLTTGADTTPKPVAIKVTGPAFLGVRLPEPTILFLFDRGSGTHATFDPMKIACLNALDTLRPDQKFQVIFWRIDRDAEPVMYPSAPVNPSPAEIRKCAAALDDVSSFGQSDVKAALEKALAANPGAIVLVTGKPVDDTFARTVLETRKDNPVKVHCLSLGEVSSAGEMREIASKTGGTFRLVPMEELKSVTR